MIFFHGILFICKSILFILKQKIISFKILIIIIDLYSQDNIFLQYLQPEKIQEYFSDNEADFSNKNLAL